MRPSAGNEEPAAQNSPRMGRSHSRGGGYYDERSGHASMISRLCRLGLLFACTLTPPAVPRAAAQDSSPQTTDARRQFGVLAFTPTLSLTMGTDSNVFNDSVDPKSDFTTTVRPEVNTWLRLGPGRLSGHSALDLMYFREFKNERSVNGQTTLRFELPLIRFKPYLAGSLLNTRQRSSFEIDARARRVENSILVGADIHLRSQTTAVLAAQRSRINFDADSAFLGTRLREVLNRDVENVSASVRHALTPLTTLVVTAGVQRDRFEFMASRNSRSLRVTPGVEFARFALITGKAYVGFCKFDTSDVGTPRYTGTVASIDLGSTLRGSTRLAVRADRDVVFSFDVRTPYYVLTGVSGSITQRITEQWDVVAWAGRQRFAYRAGGGTALPDDFGRPSSAVQYGAGIGYWIGRSFRFGLNADYARRESQSDNLRNAMGFRLNSSITYGL